MQPRRVQDGSPCVDDELLFALAHGALAADELRRVEEHLRDCSDCRSVLAEAARSLAPRSDDPPRAATRRIARYEVHALLGAGASGVVYRAFDPDLKRTVAIKVLKPDPQGKSPELAQRMLREARAMARLSAPQVVSVYDVGIEDGAVYLVMEHVQGGDLKRWLSSAPRSTDEVLRLFRDAGRGLLAAHEKDLVHLDFKPANVLVAEDGRALVTDFGLAREADHAHTTADVDAGANVELYAPTRGLVGTPAYMAPELFAGGRPSPSSDQYAFCVALFSALFGRHPYGAGEGLSLEALLIRAKLSAPLSPGELELRSGRMQRLHAVLSRGMSPTQSDRYANMADLLAALERAESTPRGRWLVALAALVLVAFAAGALLRAEQRPATVGPTVAVAAPQASVERPVVDSTRAEDPAVTSSPEAPERAARAPIRRRAPRKKADVRYNDWLKDPF